ncbi:sulfite reductase subunit alpha [Pseudoxanthomonas dokdonensis]|uniref:sulfite reductase subunit alpha n=1 Tax=Pseudoxanthomonas dokdonensis TaxID=344882 RepID=UPI001FE19E3D|nr:sulfite reductase flavoprotein subunit alpha [Pseudoxanthomonas dokdonensis]
MSVLVGLAAISFCLQRGSWWIATPTMSHWVWAVAALLAYLALSAWFTRNQRHLAEARNSATTGATITVAYASQTGFALDLAERTAQSLNDAGIDAQLVALERLDHARLGATRRLLLIASTTGEGDPPDHALKFVRQLMPQAADLHGLQYAVLALGDREYANFCAFGHQLDRWLRHAGAQPLFDLVEVDNADEGALRHWQHHLGQLSGVTDLPDWSPVDYQPWRLQRRQLLNPGSVGQPVFQLDLVPADGALPDWNAGDLVEIGPRHPSASVVALLRQATLDPEASVQVDGQARRLLDVMVAAHLPAPSEIRTLDEQALADRVKPLPHREYSLATLPSEGSARLLVRLTRHEDGSSGLGSGWLCQHADIGATIDLRVRRNPNFQPPVDAAPLILIGNGTGIAGLRAHLKHRIRQSSRRNWLLLGERQRDIDFFFSEELLAWQQAGFIERLDTAFSRDQTDRIYVQDRLRAAAGVLRQWVEDGAVILVCGSLHGMAPSVDAVLRATLGDAQVEQLIESGRYRRDVY